MANNEDFVCIAAEDGREDRTTDLGLRLVTSLCGTGSCPSVYLTDRDTVVVQGLTVLDGRADLPDGEALVEIPMALLLEAASRVERPA